MNRYTSAIVLAAGITLQAQANLIGRWTFNELGGSTVHDVSGAGDAADGTLVDGATMSGDGYLTLDGTTGYVNYGHPTKLTNVHSGYTIEAWVLDVQTPVAGHEPNIFGQNYTDIAMTKYYGTFVGYAAGGGNSTDAAYFNPTNKMLVTVTFDLAANVVSIYRNGIFSNSRTLSLGAFNPSTTLDFLTGTNLDHTQFLSGKIDEISFYDTGLSEPQVIANYNAGPTPGSPMWLAQAGDWNNPSNWGAAIPNGVDAVANFGSSITAARTVYADAPVTVGQLNFSNANSYVIAGAASLSIDVSSGNGAINLLQGSHKINLPLFVKDNTIADIAPGCTLTIGNPLTLVGGSTLTKTGAGTLSIEAPVKNVAAGTVAVMGGNLVAAVDLGGNTAVNTTGGVTTLIGRQRLTALNVGGGTVVIESGTSAALSATTLSISGGGKIDLKNSRLLITTPSALATVAAGVASGSISSSQMASGRAIGFGLASDIYSSFPASFYGETINSDATVAAFTVVGDANLDGTVSSSDFNKLVSKYGTVSGARWTQGDFNGDGKVTTLDFNLLAGQFGASLPPGAALGAVVPEPTMGALTLALAGMLVRRRR